MVSVKYIFIGARKKTHTFKKMYTILQTFLKILPRTEYILNKNAFQ